MIKKLLLNDLGGFDNTDLRFSLLTFLLVRFSVSPQICLYKPLFGPYVQFDHIPLRWNNFPPNLAEPGLLIRPFFLTTNSHIRTTVTPFYLEMKCVSSLTDLFFWDIKLNMPDITSLPSLNMLCHILYTLLFLRTPWPKVVAHCWTYRITRVFHKLSFLFLDGMGFVF